MKNLTEDKLALLTIYADSIHDILFEHNFVHDLKQAFKKVEDNTKYILERAYGNQSLEGLDEHKEKIQDFSASIIKGKFKLDEKERS